jgi:hypothetical protein
MKSIFLFVLLFVSFLVTAAQEPELVYLYGAKLAGDSQAQGRAAGSIDAANGFPVAGLLRSTEPQKKVLLFTRGKRPVTLYFFPGTSDRKALVIGGMHGSESSSIEVAETLVKQLSGGGKPFYNVVVIPSLFPDNAETALRDKKGRLKESTGRHSSPNAADPNRQMPSPGEPFRAAKPFDRHNRKMEAENQALLRLIQEYRPHRVISIHSIRDRTKAGVFADPRTDCEGMALGFDPDRELALLLAKHIVDSGGACPGNRLESAPTALYYSDPPPAPVGKKQVRSYQRSGVDKKAHGVTLGTWCSTAVCSSEPAYERPAIRTLTLEFPGYKKVGEYSTAVERENAYRMMQAYASSIRQCFLQAFLVEENSLAGNTVPVK